MKAARALFVAAVLAAPLAAIPARADDGAWQRIPQLPFPDLIGADATMAFDAAHERMLILGGYRDAPCAVWAMPIDGPELWSALPSVGGPGHLSVYAQSCIDLANQRLAVWDGGTRTLWTATLGTPVTWSGRAVSGPGPAVMGASRTFDPVRGRLVVFGGYDSAVRSDVWAITLDDTSHWVRLSSGGGPLNRMNGLLAYDASHDRLVAHGGRDFTSGSMHPRGDVWSFALGDSSGWTPLFTADTTVDLQWFDHAGLIDPVRSRLIVVGGYRGNDANNGYHREVSAFALDGSNQWSVIVLADTVSSVMNWPDATAYDPVHDRLFVFVDFTTRQLELSPIAAWRSGATRQPPPESRFGQAAAYDPVRQRWLAFGGRFTYYVYYGFYTRLFDDLWSFRNDGGPFWDSLPTAGPRPPARLNAQMLYDPQDDRMLLFGGQFTEGPGYPPRTHPGTPHFYGDIWALSLGGPPAWTPVAGGEPGPGPRDQHVTVLDTQRHRLLVFGGRDSLGAKADVWALDLGAGGHWQNLTPPGDAPAPRGNAVGVYDADADRLVIALGRGTAGSPFDDAWELRLGESPLAWRPLATLGTPPGTWRDSRPWVHDAARHRLLVFGTGNDGTEVPADSTIRVWSLQLTAPEGWSELALGAPAPTARYGAAAAMDPAHQRVAYFSGAQSLSGEYCLRDHWMLAFADPTAVELALASIDATRDRVELTWWSGADAPLAPQVERSDDGLAWRVLGVPDERGDGSLRFVDATVAPGARYAYRVSWREAGATRTTAAAWVAVPSRLSFALAVPQPNPGDGAARVAFELPVRSPGALEVFDLAGRRVERHDLAALEAGGHSIGLGAATRLRPGLYVVRLSQGGAVLARRFCVVR